ncbi:AAA domain-containing protein [Streptosporangium canum]|uniref:AAA domain-containing protein n=1 Tax=Streptosporangium canum TaxID=324952 RepID=UPI0033A6CF31
MTVWVPPSGTIGDGSLVRTGLPMTREDPRDCPTAIAAKARPWIQAAPEPPRRREELQGFTLKPLMDTLDLIEHQGLTVAQAMGELRRTRGTFDQKGRLPAHPGLLEWTVAAVPRYLAAREAEETAGMVRVYPVPEEWVVARTLGSPDRRGATRYEQTAWGRRYVSPDGSVRELWLLSFGTAKEERSSPEMAAAAHTVAFGFPSVSGYRKPYQPVEGLPTARTVRPRRVRVVGVGCGDGSSTVLAGVHIGLRTPVEWLSYVTALHAVRLQTEAEQATSALNELHTTLQHEARLGTPAPELIEAGHAVAVRDGVTYQRCLTALVDAHREQAEQRRCDELSGRVRDAHPTLLTLLTEAQTWQPHFSTWDRAWAWAKAQTFFAGQRQPGLEQRLEAELEAATAREMRLTAGLAAEQAWQAALGRMNSQQTTALRAYQDHVGKLGKGTGRYAGKYQSLAREAMVHARDAVPAWIMPLQQVLETIPPIRDSFDVVIVDEASQASIEALFLLWLAPRVIVVGDDKQCAPSVVSHGELEPIFAKLSTYLPDLPAYLRDAFTPKSSLFDLLATRFGSVLRLKEHFRCMPEIIDFSSRQFYSDEPLVPLRQFGADRLPPLRVVRVAGARSEGSATRLRNTVEAEAIVERILACKEDPAYKDKTFGVVVLQGTAQVQCIHNMLLDRLDPKDWESRRLRVGTPPDFQGDERDVVFLSMVIAEKRSAVTSTEWQRRFNVAASRAKDQMWLFHSVSPDLLSPTCLRRSLLTYMLNPPTTLLTTPLSDVNPDDPHPEFDSLFEQRVFLHIRRRGYHVVPQVEVNGRRIDLVVSGAKGRLAVECDGDFWHGTPEQREADLDRERELKRAGWRFWRIRESEFYFDSSAAMESLWSELDRRGILPGEVTAGGQNSAPSSWSALALSSDEGWDGLEDGHFSDMNELPIEGMTRTLLPPSLPTGATAAQVRVWAREHGHDVSDRGRLPEHVVTAYQHAHAPDPEADKNPPLTR